MVKKMSNIKIFRFLQKMLNVYPMELENLYFETLWFLC